jgi:hypothetical protein
MFRKTANEVWSTHIAMLQKTRKLNLKPVSDPVPGTYTLLPENTQPGELVETASEEYEKACQLESDALERLNLAKQSLVALRAEHTRQKANLAQKIADETQKANVFVLECRENFLRFQKLRGKLRRQIGDKTIAQEVALANRLSRNDKLHAIRIDLIDVKAHLRQIKALSRRGVSLSNDPRLEEYLPHRLKGESIPNLLTRLFRHFEKKLLELEREYVRAKAGPIYKESAARDIFPAKPSKAVEEPSPAHSHFDAEEVAKQLRKHKAPKIDDLPVKLTISKKK